MASQNDTNAAVQTALTARPVTVAALLTALGAIVAAIFQPLGGDLSGSLPNPAVVSTQGAPFAPSATTNALNASNISSGTLAPARSAPIGGANSDVTCAPSGDGARLVCTVVGTGGGGASWREIMAPLTVTATNTLSALPNAYDGRICKLIVNGLTLTDKDANVPFTVSGTTITWSQANAGYALQTNFVVTSDCTY